MTRGHDPEVLMLSDLRNIALCEYVQNDLRSTNRLEIAFQRLEQFLGDVPAATIPIRLTDYIRRRKTERAYRGKPVRPSTIRYELNVLHRAYHLAVVLGRYPGVPVFPTVRVGNNAREDFVTRPQLERVLSRLPAYLGPFCRWAFITGWRLREISTLAWDQVDLQRGVASIRPELEKAGRGRSYPYGASPELKAIIEGQRRLATRAPWVFQSERDETPRKRGYRGKNGHPVTIWWQAWKRATAAAGVPSLTFHGLRRSSVRNYILAGIPEPTIMKLGGWTTRSMVTRYAVASQEDLAEAVGRLAGVPAGT